jgi:hypothetical protein
MSLPDFLYVLLVVMTVGYVPLAAAMIAAAREKPAIWALTLFAYLTVTIAGLIVVYLAAVANAQAGSPVPSDVAKSILRLFLIPLAVFPYLFWWVYKTNRFRDGGS